MRSSNPAPYPIRVLLVEDDREEYALTRLLLKRVVGVKYDVEWRDTYEAAKRRVLAQEHDVYLFDHKLGQGTGLELLREVVGAGCRGPIILLTVSSDPELDRLAMAAGAADYLVKGSIDSALIERSIRYSIERKRIEQELVLAKRMAEEAVRVKTEFLANMSHELRTPLNGIFGMTNLLLKSEMSLDQRHCIDTIRASCDNLLFMINEVLDFSQIDAGTLKLEKAVCRPRNLVTGLVRSFTSEALNKGLALECSVDDRVPQSMIADSNRLSQILINLIANALKFTERGTVSVSVERARKARSATEIRFTVRDTGIGISKVDRRKIFEAFERGDTSMSRRFGGIGLGLAISRKLVQLMGGDIWIESEEDHGTAVSFTIQALAAPAVESQSRVRRVPASGRSDRDFAHRFPLRVLVVEDNAVNRTVMQHTLAALGYRPDLAPTGGDALAALKAKRYEVVLLDLHMPTMDGFEVVRRIKETHAASSRPTIVAVTASATQEVRKRCLEAGMAGYLSKPVVLEKLATILRRCATNPHSTGPALDPWQGDASRSTEHLGSQDEDTPPASVDPEVLDRLRRLSAKGGHDLLSELIESFCKRAPAVLQQLGLAVAENAAETIEEKAHFLKGSTATIGAARLSWLCGRLEKMAEAKSTSGAGRLLDEIEAEHVRVLELLKKEVSAA